MRLWISAFSLACVVAAPIVVLVVIAVRAARGTQPVRVGVLVGVVGAGLLSWAPTALLYPHERPCATSITRCPTVFGTEPAVTDDSPLGYWLLLGGFLLVALVVGWFRWARPHEIGAALALGPMVAAIPTTPRGDNDGLWVLTLVVLPILGMGAAIAAAGATAAGDRWRARQGQATLHTQVAQPAERVAALVVDLVLTGFAVWAAQRLRGGVPDTVVTVLSFGVFVAYVAASVHRRGATLGQQVMGLQVLDADAGTFLAAGRATLRAALLTAELTVCALFPPLLLTEVVVMVRRHDSLLDRLVGVRVVAQRAVPAELSSPLTR